MGLLYIVFRRAHQAAVDARRRASTAGYLGWAFLASLTLCLAIAAVVVVASEVWLLGGLWAMAIGLLLVCTVPVMGPWLLRHVLVPRGAVKLAYHCGRFSVTAGTDPQALALVAAAWAALGAKRKVSGDALAWIEKKREARGALGDAEVVATAFLLACHDADAARALLQSVPELVELHPAVRELAGEWLAVDAAERGAWAELLPAEPAAPEASEASESSEASAPKRDTARWPATPLRFFLEGVAARRLGHPSAPSMAGLRARWLMAPARRQTRELLALAAAGAVASEQRSEREDQSLLEQIVEEASARANPSLARAVALHVMLGRAPAAAGAYGLGRLASLWDAAFAADEMHLWLERRAAELGAPYGAARRACDEVMEAVASQLRATIEAQRWPAPPQLRSRFGQLLGSKLRHGRLDELELQFTRWADRVEDGTPLPAAEEWREFLAVRQSYRDLVTSGGEELRRLAFPHVFNAANRAAVALWNRREEVTMAHAILAWELVEARAVGDSQAIELSAKNAALKFSTRTGPWSG